MSLVNAAMARDEDSLASVRAEIVKTMGADALVDAAAIIGNFNQMVRIADGTGIPLDPQLDFATQAMREEIGVNEFVSAANTPVAGAVKRMLGKAMERAVAPVQARLLRAAAKLRS